MISFAAKAQLNTFSPNQAIQANLINQNVDNIKNILDGYQIPLTWSNKISGDLISENDFLSLFSSLNNYTLSGEAQFSGVLSLSPIHSELNNSFTLLENQAKDIVPQNCLEILQRNPSLLGADGIYKIDTDGFGNQDSPHDVYCDMTTDGGGWTNVANNMGDYSNQLDVKNIILNNAVEAIGNSTNISAMGLSDSSQADTIINGFNVSEIADGSCKHNDFLSLFLEPSLMARYGATRVKLEAKSYASHGVLACGGILFRVDETNLIKHGSFPNQQLGTCNSGVGTRFSDFQNYDFLTFSFEPDSSYEIATLIALCSSSPARARVHIKSIMIR